MTKEELQSYANQINWCGKSKQYLIDLTNELHSLSSKYQENLDGLRTKGCVDNALSIVADMNREFQTSSSDLIGHIEKEHLDYIEKQSFGLRGDLDAFMGGS